MKVPTIQISAILPFLLAIALFFSANPVLAEELKIAVLDMQKVVLNSHQGKKAQQEMEERVGELEKAFKQDEDALTALEDEIDKKSSVWSKETTQEKTNEVRILRRELKAKQDDANIELKQLQEKKLAPIFKELETVVTKFAKDNNYSIILPGQAVLFAVEGVDITAEVTDALNALPQ